MSSLVDVPKWWEDFHVVFWRPRLHVSCSSTILKNLRGIYLITYILYTEGKQEDHQPKIYWAVLEMIHIIYWQKSVNGLTQQQRRLGNVVYFCTFFLKRKKMRIPKEDHAMKVEKKYAVSIWIVLLLQKYSTSFMKLTSNINQYL